MANHRSVTASKAAILCQRQEQARRHRGFTLIELLVFVLALAWGIDCAAIMCYSEPMQNTLTPYQRGWLEAAIDGEGSLGLYFSRDGANPRPRVVVRLCISNTDEAFVQKARDIIGAGCVTHSRNDRWREKTCYRLFLSGVSLRPLLVQLSLLTKARQQKLVTEALGLLGQRCGLPGRTGGACRPLWKDRRLMDIKAELNTLNRGRGKAPRYVDLVASSHRKEEP